MKTHCFDYIKQLLPDFANNAEKIDKIKSDIKKLGDKHEAIKSYTDSILKEEMDIVNHNTQTNKEAQNLFLCPYCGVVSKMIWVHGHGQCDKCKINVDECCRGEDATCRLTVDTH